MASVTFAGCPVVRGRSKFSKAQLISALRKSGGIQAEAARLLGVDRSAVCKRLQRDPQLESLVEEITAEIADAAEAVIVAAIRKGDLATSRWYLERKGKERGYGRAGAQRLTDQEADVIISSLSKPELEALCRLSDG